MSYRSHPALDNALIDVDDTLLILAVRSGDRVALEKLYLRYYRRLACFLARIAACREAIEEIINDTFMIVWTHAIAFRSETLVSTWIVGTTYRLAMRSIGRQKGQSPGRCVCMLSEQCADSAHDTEMTNSLDCAVGQLPVTLRVTVTLAYQMGFSIEEISQITDSPTDTVKSSMLQACSKLRDVVKELRDGG
jgi:RNA polymerase sigma factor (sigma-70 family)